MSTHKVVAVVAAVVDAQNMRQKHQRRSHTFLLKSFLKNRGCSLSVRTSGQCPIHLQELTLLIENLKLVRQPNKNVKIKLINM